MSARASYSHHERDYLERTIATVRNHRDADNCWPQWANIFADEIERLWVQLGVAEAYIPSRDFEDYRWDAAREIGRSRS